MAVALCGCASASSGQVIAHRGFIDGSVAAFPQRTPNDSTQVVADLILREEVFVKPTGWLQFAGGIDARANSYDQVEERWTVRWWDRGERRPRLAARRLSATIARGPVTVDIGKQFVRWGTTDLVNPTDRFAARDFVNVVNAEFLGVTAARAVTQLGRHTLDLVWAPRFTPGRLPPADQRWAVAPAASGALPVVQTPVSLPSRRQLGLRWGHAAGTATYSLSFFDGHNYQPDFRPTVRLESPAQSPESAPLPVAIDIARVYADVRSYGGDVSLPVRWATVKAEAAFVTSPSATSDDYGLYVIQLERQSGEWVFVGGYIGEVLTRRRSALTFSPERGSSRSIVGRIGRTVGVHSSFTVEAAVRQNGQGGYGKADYSRTHGQHWRTTATVVGLAGHDDDFFGRYRRNSHLRLALRYSF